MSCWRLNHEPRAQLRSGHGPLASDQLQHATTVLTHAITAGKAAIQERIAVSPELSSMGTTVVLAWLCPSPPSGHRPRGRQQSL